MPDRSGRFNSPTLPTASNRARIARSQKQTEATAKSADGLIVMDRLIDQQVSIRDLRERALATSTTPRSLQDWVYSIFQQPQRVRPKRVWKSAMATSFQDGQIGYWELMSFAKGWDAEGRAHPVFFVDAVECETVGTPKYEAVRDQMPGIRTNPDSDEPEEPDEWGEWRYGDSANAPVV